MIRRHTHVLLISQYWLLRVNIHSKSLESFDHRALWLTYIALIIFIFISKRRSLLCLTRGVPQMTLFGTGHWMGQSQKNSFSMLIVWYFYYIWYYNYSQLYSKCRWSMTNLWLVIFQSWKWLLFRVSQTFPNIRTLIIDLNNLDSLWWPWQGIGNIMHICWMCKSQIREMMTLGWQLKQSGKWPPSRPLHFPTCIVMSLLCTSFFFFFFFIINVWFAIRRLNKYILYGKGFLNARRPHKVPNKS